MALEDTVFVDYVRKMFKERGSDYDSLKASFGEEFQVFCHFYYYICRPESSEDEVRDEFRFIGMTSLMEALMGKLPQSLKKSKKNVRAYFRRYFSNGADEIEPMGILLWREVEKDFVPLVRVQDIADFLYHMRSEFVHEAQMHSLNSTRVDTTLTRVKDGIYEITLSVEEFLRKFEDSFVCYWKDRAAQYDTSS